MEVCTTWWQRNQSYTYWMACFLQIQGRIFWLLLGDWLERFMVWHRDVWHWFCACKRFLWGVHKRIVWLGWGGWVHLLVFLVDFFIRTRIQGRFYLSSWRLIWVIWYFSVRVFLVFWLIWGWLFYSINQYRFLWTFWWRLVNWSTYFLLWGPLRTPPNRFGRLSSTCSLKSIILKNNNRFP